MVYLKKDFVKDEVETVKDEKNVTRDDRFDLFKRK